MENFMAWLVDFFFMLAQVIFLAGICALMMFGIVLLAGEIKRRWKDLFSGR